MKLTLARPEYAEHIAAFYSALHTDDFPHTEMFAAATVAQLLRDEEIAVIIATRGRDILGCALGFPQTWNNSLEIGSLSIEDVPEKGQVSKALFEALRRLGLKSYGLCFLRARTQNSFKRARDIGATCWGFRLPPGARSIDEAELLMGFVDEEAAGVRIRPPVNTITETPFARVINQATGGQVGDIPYPKNFPVGAPRGTGTPVISGRIWPTYHSRGNFITIESSAGPYPVEIILEFVKKVREKGVSDIRLTLPVNQEQAYVDLLEFGFDVTGYLPGWFLRGGSRFDCVEMQAGLPRVPRSPSTFVERAIRKISDDLAVG